MIHAICGSMFPRGLNLAASLLVALPVTALAPARVALPTGPTGEVHGHVIAGPPSHGLSAATVGMMHLSGERHDDRSVVTDSGGAFAFHQLAPGLYEMSVHRIGYKPSFVEIKVTGGGNLDLTIQLTSAVRVLDTVAVDAQEMPQQYGRSLRMAEFYDRRQRGVGHFFTREDIDAAGVQSAGDLISRVGGMHVTQGPQGIEVKSIGCTGMEMPVINLHDVLADTGRVYASRPDSADGWGKIALYVDGAPVLPADRNIELGSIRPEQIEAMEVYRSPTELPAEAVGNACAAVYVWTRTGASDY